MWSPQPRSEELTASHDSLTLAGSRRKCADCMSLFTRLKAGRCMMGITCSVCRSRLTTYGVRPRTTCKDRTHVWFAARSWRCTTAEPSTLSNSWVYKGPAERLQTWTNVEGMEGSRPTFAALWVPLNMSTESTTVQIRRSERRVDVSRLLVVNPGSGLPGWRCGNRSDNECAVCVPLCISAELVAVQQAVRKP